MKKKPRQAPAGVRDVVTLLIEDRQLQRFTLARFLMSATALAPPFILSAAHGDGSAPGSQLGSLGPFVLASSIASILGSSAWGVASDRSSRRVMICAALLAAVVLGAMAAVLLSAGQQIELPVLETSVALFVLMMAYQGVRRGRSTHIVDMAPQDQKSSYAAVSNTVVGLLLLGGGVLGVIADVFGLAVVFVLLAVMCVAGAMVAFGLQDVQST
jgi:MFS family permease